MVTTLARIVAEASEQTRSPRDAFASVNNDFSPRKRRAASGALIDDYTACVANKFLQTKSLPRHACVATKCHLQTKNLPRHACVATKCHLRRRNLLSHFPPPSHNHPCTSTTKMGINNYPYSSNPNPQGTQIPRVEHDSLTVLSDKKNEQHSTY